MSTTLLITTHNRAGLLSESLRRLADLTLPDEVLVVDDGGEDDTHEVCNAFVDQLPIRYVHHDNPGVTICSMARNVGLKLATGSAIITAEPEIVFATDVVAQLLAARTDHPDEVISAGIVHFANQGAEWQHARNQPPTLGWVAPFVALYERAWLEEIGGWDETFPGAWGWDDTDLLTRLRLSGRGQYIDPTIAIVHQWHGLGADPGSINEAHFFAKDFHTNEDNSEDVVANRGRAWGTLRTKTS